MKYSILILSAIAILTASCNQTDKANVSPDKVQTDTVVKKIPISAAISDIMVKNGLDSGIKAYYYLHEHEPQKYDFSVGQLNILGYQAIKEWESNAAIQIFLLNIHFFPNSSSAYYGLASAYISNRDRSNAIASLKKVVSIDSSNSDASALLDRLNKLPAISSVEFVCPPCNCKGDSLTFYKSGVCPYCKMVLVNKPLFTLAIQN